MKKECVKAECNCEKTVGYKCAICGKEYEDIEGRIACETKCLQERKEAEKKRKQFELEQEKVSRKAEVDNAYDKYRELVDAYVKDYGSYRFYSKPSLTEIEEFFKEW